MIKKVILFVMILSIITTLIGCDNYNKNASIYFELYNQPKTLDAQTAESISELVAVRNIYEGLVRKDANGEIVCGVADSYTYSDNTYTFKLKNDCQWSDSTPLTAYDFEFALKRAVDKKTKAPFVSKLFSIKNAKSIYNGNLSNDKLGVIATDEKTLKITLSQNDKDFLDTLTTSIAMPCNEKFFYSCIGKYGLTREYTLSNGSYYLSRWNQENFKIKLSRNEKYNGKFVAKNAAVFLTRNEEETALELLENDDVDASFIDCALTSKAQSIGLHTQSFENTCWVLTISNDIPYNVRKSLAMLCGGDYLNNNLNEGFRIADSLFPAVFSNDKLQKTNSYDLKGGKQLYFEAIKGMPDKKFPANSKLFFYDNGYFKDTITATVGHWQSNLGAFINIQPVEKIEDLIGQLTKQTQLMAIFPVSSENNNIREYLLKFGVAEKNPDLNSIQKELLSGYNIVPLAFSNTTIAYGNGVDNLTFDTENGYIDFSTATKK